MSAILSAVEYGDIDAVRTYLEAGNKPDEKINGMTLLEFACRIGQLEIVKLLLEHGADPNLKDSLGLTPLLIALMFQYQNTELIKELILRGASVLTVDNRVVGRGKSIAQMARDGMFSSSPEIAVAILAAEMLELTESGATAPPEARVSFANPEVKKAAVELMKRRAGLRRGRAAAVYTGPRGGSRQRRKTQHRHRKTQQHRHRKTQHHRRR